MTRFGFPLALSLTLASATGICGVMAPTAYHHPDNRWYTGIPSITVSPVNGRLWATWYTSLTDQEDSYNYCILATSADDGKTWKEVLVADPDGVGPLRAFDPEVWVAPDGKLKWTWTERRGTVFSDPKNDKLQMVSLSAEEEPSAPYPAARTIARGVMMCKPIVHRGEWLFPVAHWREAPSSCIYATRDGIDFRLVGGATIPNPCDREFDETALAEMPDGCLRMFIRGGSGPLESFSSDGGRTWTEARRSKWNHAASRLFVCRLKSGNLLMVRHGKLHERIPDRGFLRAYVSRDGGDTWEGGLSVDERNYLSYQDGCELADGRIAIIYDCERFTRREVLMATFTEADALAGRDVSGKCSSNRVVSCSCTGGTGIDPRAGRYLLPDGNRGFRIADFSQRGEETNAVVEVTKGAKPTVEWSIRTWPRGVTLRWDAGESTVSFPKIAERLRTAVRPVVRCDLNLICHQLTGSLTVQVVTAKGVFETPYTEELVNGGVMLPVACPAPPRDIRFKLSGSGWFTLRFLDEIVPPLTAPRRVLEFNPTPQNQRNSEGDFAVLRDGSILFAYTRYGAGFSDEQPAAIAFRKSTDGGLTWTEKDLPQTVRDASVLNSMSCSFLRLQNGDLALFYLIRRTHADMRPVMRVSKDEGRTWSAPKVCVSDANVGYYVLNNSRVLRLKDGRILLPLCKHAVLNADHPNMSLKYDMDGEDVCAYSDDDGATWRLGTSTGPVFDAQGKRVTVQEPGVVELKDGRVWMYARTGHGRQWSFYSRDRGESWTKGEPSNIVGPCSPATVKRLSNGDLFLVWNDHETFPEYAERGRRTPYTVAISKDDGRTLRPRHVLEGDAMTQHRCYCYCGFLEHQGTILLSYAANLGLQHMRITAVPVAWLYTPDSGRTPFFGNEPTPVQWEKSLFDKVPATYPAFGRTNAIETLFYEGVPHHGQPTRVFAYMGVPKSKDGKPVPGMVLVHGGGGSAFYRWVKYWNDQGYAAIAMDLSGCVSGNVKGIEQWPHTRHDWAGPRGAEGWNEINEKVSDQWPYHAVAAVVRAHTLLRAQPGVDKDRIGVTGISWGGFLTCIASGVDERFKFAAPVYGCGFIQDHSMWKDRGWGGCSKEALAEYVKLWDPAHYVPHATMPILFVDSTSDHAYPIDIVEKTAELTNVRVTRVVDHQFGHAHFKGSEERPEILAFANGLFGRGPKLPRATRYIHMGGGFIANFDLGGMKVKSAELMYTTDKGDTRRRKWLSAPAKVTGGQVAGRVPSGATGHYVKLVTESGLLVTTSVALTGPHEDEEWSGTVTVDKPLVFDGMPLTVKKGATVRFVGAGRIEVKGAAFTADGATFVSDTTLTNGWRLSVSGGKVFVRSCRFRGLKTVNPRPECWFRGFALVSSSDVALENNAFSDCSPLMLAAVRKARVVGNGFVSCDIGLSLLNVEDSFVATNTFRQVRNAGLDLSATRQVAFEGNVFDGCAHGLRVYNSHHNRIVANRHGGAKANGQEIFWAVGNVLSNNVYGAGVMPFVWNRSLPSVWNVYDAPGAADENNVTEDPRWCKIPGLRNVRDIGGWHGLRAGRAFRGSYLFRNAEGRLDEATRDGLAKLGVRTDLDLRGAQERTNQQEAFEDMSVAGLKSVNIPITAYAPSVGEKRADFAKALKVFVDAKNYPIYFHCKAGADRTGTLALVLEGLCGVPEEDLLKDYELTSVGFNARNRKLILPVLEKVKTYPGAALREKFAAAAKDLWGLSDAEISSIRTNLR